MIAVVLTLSVEIGPGRLGGANAQGIIRIDSETEAYRQGYEDGQRAALERGDGIAPEAYCRLDGDLCHGRELKPDYGYGETDEGTRLLLELATGIIAEVLGEPTYVYVRPPERRERRGAGIGIPPGHYLWRGAL